MATRFIMTSKWRSNTELFVTDIFMPLHAQRGVTSATTDSYDDMLSRFHLIPERYGQIDRRTDRQTDLLYQYRASVC